MGKKKEETLNPILVDFTEGFFDLEENAQKNWRWGNNKAKINLNNLSNRIVKMKVEFSVSTGYSNFSNLEISGMLTNHLSINQIPTLVSAEIILKPGKNLISFETDSIKIFAPNDSRSMYFRIENFKMEEKKN
ncbi:hypothetical protein N6H13_20065 [Paenibacillus sp. CC-CFT742]|nr:hypothetical protein [Paenibacillus sp. CC-CFT742]WJH27539.1 hypothetical protein N6H13_20065 [Paenibacillus sp. CC-CFT742]